MKKIIFVIMILVVLGVCISCLNNRSTFDNPLSYLGMTFYEFRDMKEFKNSQYAQTMIAEPDLVIGDTDNTIITNDTLYFYKKDCFGYMSDYSLSFREDTKISDEKTNDIVFIVITKYSENNSLLKEIKNKYVRYFIDKYNGKIKKEFGRDKIIFYFKNKKMYSLIEIKDSISVRVSIGYE